MPPLGFDPASPTIKIITSRLTRPIVYTVLQATVTRIALETEGESKSEPRDYLRFPSKRSAKQRLASARLDSTRLDSDEEAKYTRRDERKLNSQSHGGKREAPLRPPPTPNHPSLYRNQCAKEGKGPGHESDLDSSEQRALSLLLRFPVALLFEQRLGCRSSADTVTLAPFSPTITTRVFVRVARLPPLAVDNGNTSVRV